MAKAGVIIPLAILGTVVLAVGGLYLTVMDWTPSTYEDAGISNEQVLRRQLVRSLKNSKTEKKIEYKIDQDSLNQILLNSRKSIKLDDPLNEMIGDFYVEIDGENYRFYVNGDFKAIKTRVVIDTTLTSDEENYYFIINKINAGHFPAYGILKNTGLLSQVPLEDAFKNAGLNVKVDYENDRLMYPRKNLEEDIMKMMSSNTDDLMKGAIETLALSFDFKEGIGASGNLEPLIKNDAVSDCSSSGSHYDYYYKIEDSIASATKTIGDKLKEANVSDEAINETSETAFKSIQQLFEKGDEVNTIMKDRIRSIDFMTYSSGGIDVEVAGIDESEINSVLLTTGILGKSYIFYFQDEFSYVVVDNFYCDIFSNEEGSFINYTVGVNLNGLETRAIIETKCSPIVNEFAAEFDITNIYYGEKKASSQFAKVAKDFLKDALESMDDSSWMNYQPSNDTMTIDFSKLIKEDEELDPYKVAFYESEGTRSFTLSNNKLEENGRLSIRFAK